MKRLKNGEGGGEKVSAAVLLAHTPTAALEATIKSLNVSKQPQHTGPHTSVKIKMAAAKEVLF